MLLNAMASLPHQPNFRTLDLNLLRVFDEVMAERSLTRAARNLALTQPAVSNALRRLRETLGDELVRRSGQGMEPTPRALALWPAVRDALRQLQQSLAPSRFDPAQADTTFVLAMADATAAELVPKLVDIIEAERRQLGQPAFRVAWDREVPGALEATLSAGLRDVSFGLTPASTYSGFKREVAEIVQAREEGKIDSIVVWTLDREMQLAEMLYYSVDGLITNDTALLHRMWRETQD